MTISSLLNEGQITGTSYIREALLTRGNKDTGEKMSVEDAAQAIIKAADEKKMDLSSLLPLIQQELDQNRELSVQDREGIHELVNKIIETIGARAIPKADPAELRRVFLGEKKKRVGQDISSAPLDDKFIQ